MKKYIENCEMGVNVGIDKLKSLCIDIKLRNIIYTYIYYIYIILHLIVLHI